MSLTQKYKDAVRDWEQVGQFARDYPDAAKAVAALLTGAELALRQARPDLTKPDRIDLIRGLANALVAQAEADDE